MRATKPALYEDSGEDDGLFEMANLRPDRTGLPFVVFVSQKGGARHDVRVKVSPTPKARPQEMATVAVRPSVELLHGDLSSENLALLARWIDLNRRAIVDYWEGRIEYTEDLLAVLRPLS